MAATRNNVQDFMSAVRGRGINGGTSNNVYGATLNADGSVLITKNFVTLYSKVWWPGTGAAGLTDASSPNQDTVSIQDVGSGYFVTGGAQNFINSLL